MSEASLVPRHVEELAAALTVARSRTQDLARAVEENLELADLVNDVTAAIDEALELCLQLALAESQEAGRSKALTPSLVSRLERLLVLAARIVDLIDRLWPMLEL